uniref:ArfGAP with RhoGAP domain, ankyrin repeat and PH domain 3 n=1 Tax=Oncorhynchus mykiss TaxID=8022 RepID=A0A8K9XX63_ONCMY
MATIDGNTDVETLLAAIHLERYLKTFRQSGFLLARDLSHLDNGALIQLGVTATGHRKRILRLVQHIQRATNQNQLTSEPLEPLLDQQQQQYNGNVVIKPVPKPRTVFYRHKTEPARFLSCPIPPTSPDPHVLTLTRKPSQESLCFTILEGLASGEFNTDTVMVGPTLNPAPTPTLRHSLSLRESRLSNSSDSGGPQPPVPPRLNREAAPPPLCLSLPPNLYPSEPDEDQTISPYASYTSLSEQTEPIICGWLDKLSPQGNYVFQKRYVKFDGKNLLYFGSEKDPYPKGVIPLAAIQMARMAKDNKFEIVTSHRTFVFRADNEVQRHQWCSTLQGRVKEQLVFGRPRFGPGSHCQRSGPLELKGTKAKIYVAINTEQVWLYKTEQCFRNGIGITLIEARGATIRDGKGKSFDLITPYKTFSFTAESERDKRDWMEAIQESIAETLSDYEVAEKIWSNRFNKLCADCQAVNPDWASINLCVVICKNCAGQHRGLGTMVSKVQSLKLDTSVWSNEIVQLFIMLGNDRANEFWAARLSPADELDRDATPDQRREFIIHKYREGRYRHPHPNFNTQEELLKVQEHHCLAFKCSATIVERNGLYFCCYSPPDFQKYWCTVERSLLFYESDRCPDPSMKINVKDIVCLGVSRPDSCNNNGFIDRLEDQSCCHCLLAREFERVGVLRYKAMRDPSQWKEGYFVLQKSNLFICPGNDGAAEDIINLKRLQELSESPVLTKKKEILVLVEKGRTLHLQGMGRLDFSLWYADIQRAAGGKGNTLREQQLSRNDIPIIVDSCIAFITQYGLGHEGIYRKNGATSRIKLLMEEFRNDARNVKLRIGDNFIEDVTDVLKRFFREIDDPIFMADLHQLWKEAVSKYRLFSLSLSLGPRVQKCFLSLSLGPRVQKCADLNQMCTKNLSLLFAPSLFQTDGKGEHEVKIVEDLIDNYLYIFDIDEEQQTQIELELSLITTWKDTQLSQAGDLIIEVYLEKKMADCCITLKVSPTMGAEELTNQVLYMRNIPAGEKDVWLTFETIEEGQLERPLHPKEKVLEQALQWCKMADPSSAYLVVKRVPKGEDVLFTAYKSEIIKMGVLKCREEPPKLLHGKVFQEHTFQIKDHKLLLLKDKKSIKPEKEWPLKSMKIYMGIRKKLKPPTRWGFTLMMEKQQLYLCCFCESDLWDWVTNFLKAQNDDPRPPVLRRHSSSDISKQKFGTMPLVPIRGDGHESNSTMLSANQTLVRLHSTMLVSNQNLVRLHSTMLVSNQTLVRLHLTMLVSNQTLVRLHSTMLVSNQTLVRLHSTMLVSNQTLVRLHSTMLVSNQTLVRLHSTMLVSNQTLIRLHSTMLVSNQTLIRLHSTMYGFAGYKPLACFPVCSCIMTFCGVLVRIGVRKVFFLFAHNYLIFFGGKWKFVSRRSLRPFIGDWSTVLFLVGVGTMDGILQLSVCCHSMRDD